MLLVFLLHKNKIAYTLYLYLICKQFTGFVVPLKITIFPQSFSAGNCILT